MKIAICIPCSWMFIPQRFFVSYTQLLFGLHGLGPVELSQYVFSTAPLDRCRNELASEALKEYPDWLLWLDADQTFPHDMAKALINSAETHGLDIIGGSYHKKTPPFDNVAGWHSPKPGRLHYIKFLDSRKPGVHEVDVVGMGATLIRAKVFQTLDYPWFEYRENEDGVRSVTEDIPFCDKAKQAGFKIAVDTRVQCGHIVQGEVGINHYIEYKKKGDTK